MDTAYTTNGGILEGRVPCRVYSCPFWIYPISGCAGGQLRVWNFLVDRALVFIKNPGPGAWSCVTIGGVCLALYLYHSQTCAADGWMICYNHIAVVFKLGCNNRRWDAGRPIAYTWCHSITRLPVCRKMTGLILAHIAERRLRHPRKCIRLGFFLKKTSAR